MRSKFGDLGQAMALFSIILARRFDFLELMPG